MDDLIKRILERIAIAKNNEWSRMEKSDRHSEYWVKHYSRHNALKFAESIIMDEYNKENEG